MATEVRTHNNANVRGDDKTHYNNQSNSISIEAERKIFLLRQ